MRSTSCVLVLGVVGVVISACGNSSSGSGSEPVAIGGSNAGTTDGFSGNATIAGTTSNGGASAGAGTAGAAIAGNSPGGATMGGTGNGGSGGAGGAGSAAGCTVAPVNPNATLQAKNLLCYLYSQFGNHVISGQQETSWSNPQGDIDWYTSNGMKPPAILGGDYLYPDGTSDRAIAYFKAGGIPMIRYHMGAPPLEDTYENSKSSTNIDNVLQDGTPENTSFKSKLDYAASELKKLQDANVAVLWTPFHEVQQGGWFWWAKGTGPQFVSLWKLEFDYLTKTKGLNNLVWLCPFSGAPSSPYFPGKQYLDISGPDTYDENEPFGGLFSLAKSVVGDGMPIPLHETGRIPTPSAMFPSAAPWVLFNVWATYQNDGMHNTLANIQSVYADPHTVTRDEVPDLNATTPPAAPPPFEAAPPSAPAASAKSRHSSLQALSPEALREAQKAWANVKSLDGAGHFAEAQDAARRLLRLYPNTPVADDAERHTLVYPLGQPSREAQQAAAQ